MCPLAESAGTALHCTADAPGTGGGGRFESEKLEPQLRSRLEKQAWGILRQTLTGPLCTALQKCR